MNRAASICTVLIVVFAADSADAISGTVSGCIFFDDERNETSALTESRHLDESGGSLDPITGARVLVLGGGGGSVGESTTTSTGCFSIAWNDPLVFWLPTTGYKFRVEMRNPSDFRVTDETDALFTYTTNITIEHSVEAIGNFTLDDDEQALVYQTAQDFWFRIVENIGVNSRMTSVRVSATVPFNHDWGGGIVCNTGCMLDANHVSIPDNDGLNFPVTRVAHELGHSLVTHALDEGDWNAPAGCTDLAHGYTTTETCDAHPWNEGFANFWAVLFAFTNDATAAHFGTTLNTTEVLEGICSTSPTPRRIEACVTAALWDIYDDPPGDDDAMDGSPNTYGGTINDTLDAYCWGTSDRCQAESGPHGRNAWDFLANFSGENPSLQNEAESIYAATGIDIGGDGPFP